MQNFDDLVKYASSFGTNKVAVAFPHHEVIFKALHVIKEKNIAEPILIGDAEKIKKIAYGIGYDLSDDEIVHETDSYGACELAVQMVREQSADLIMKGKVQTYEFIKAVLKRDAGLRTGNLLSQVVVVHSPVYNRFMILSDGGVNIAPNLEQKAAISKNAIAVAHALGIENPKLVALAAAEVVDENIPATVDAHELKMMNQRGEITGAVIDGPLALDTPLDSKAAEMKGIDSPVAGVGDIFISPTIECSNILYRSILYFGKARSGGITYGAKIPLIHMSRADTVDAKVNSTALAVVVLHKMRENEQN